MGGSRAPCNPDLTGFCVFTVWEYALPINPRLTENRMNDASKMEAEDVLRVELEELRRGHRDLDDAIAALDDTHRADPLRLRRLKKEKLTLKDKIAVIEDKLTPDIIA